MDEDDNDEEINDLYNESLEGPVSRVARPTTVAHPAIGGMKPPLLEDSDGDF